MFDHQSLLALVFAVVLILIIVLAIQLYSRVIGVRKMSGGAEVARPRTRPQPDDHYRDNIYVIGHIAGVSGAGKTHFGERCKVEFPELVVQDLDDFADELPHTEFTGKRINEKLASRWKHIEMRVKQFTLAHAGKPILFVGYNSEGDHWLSMLGVKLFLDPPISRVITQRVARETSLGHAPSGSDVVEWLNNNNTDYETYSNAGYQFMNAESCMHVIRLSYRNMMYRIGNPHLFASRSIVWVNGPSASGKSTLLKRLSTLSNIRVCDLDAIDDKNTLEHEDFDQRVSANFEAVRREMSADLTRGVVFVGLSVYLLGIPNHLYAIDVDPEVNYVRGQLRELDTVCKNSDLIKRQLHVSDNLGRQVDKLRTQIEHRTPVILDPYNVITNIRRARSELMARGFELMSADDILDRISSL